MTSAAETVSLALMVLFGIATAVVLAFTLRDVVARIAYAPPRTGRSPPGPGNDPGDGSGGRGSTDDFEAAVRRAQRIALLGPPIYLLGFVVVVAALVIEVGPVAGVRLLDVGLAGIVAAAVPMAAGFYLARTASREHRE